ncbi:unnamed protein product [Moneuplotes crassus]|uniref:Uncharacterized protein n=1 Tax=Euplotes crassus TaxID=5936 RepID=A0AAD1Y3W6_EUPCR|nr:unnamed protein product [Moneuplotes crassus]
MEPNEIIFGEGFFENLSFYRNYVQERNQGDIPDEPQPQLPTVFEQPESRVVASKSDHEKRDEEIQKLTQEVIPMRNQLSNLHSEYSTLVENSIKELKNANRSDELNYVDNALCSNQYSSLVECVKESSNNKELERGKISNTGYMVHKFCLSERLSFRQCVQRNPNNIDDELVQEAKISLLHRLTRGDKSIE